MEDKQKGEQYRWRWQNIIIPIAVPIVVALIGLAGQMHIGRDTKESIVGEINNLSSTIEIGNKNIESSISNTESNIESNINNSENNIESNISNTENNIESNISNTENNIKTSIESIKNYIPIQASGDGDTFNIAGNNMFAQTPQPASLDDGQPAETTTFTNEYFGVDQGQPLVIISGVRKLGSTDSYGKNVVVSPGDTVEVEATVRNISGRQLLLGVNCSLAEGLRYVDGSSKFYSRLDDGTQLGAIIDRWTNIGLYAVYNGFGYGEGTIYYQVRVPAVSETDKRGLGTFHINNEVAGYDTETRQVVTNAIMYDVSITVDFGN